MAIFAAPRVQPYPSSLYRPRSPSFSTTVAPPGILATIKDIAIKDEMVMDDSNEVIQIAISALDKGKDIVKEPENDKEMEARFIASMTCPIGVTMKPDQQAMNDELHEEYELFDDVCSEGAFSDDSGVEMEIDDEEKPKHTPKECLPEKTTFRWPMNEKNLIESLTEFRQRVLQRQINAIRTGRPILEADVKKRDEGIVALGEVKMTSDVLEKTKIGDALKLMKTESFPEAVQFCADSLLHKWEMELHNNTSQRAAPRQNTSQSESSKSATRRKQAHTPGSERFPSSKHGIWGDNGIMDGTMLGPNNTPIVNPQRKRNWKVYGNNGLQIGDWYPKQIVVLARGGHGSTQGGICAGPSGAYSIICGSSMYSDLDKDQGDILYYSEPTPTDKNAKKNEHNKGTKALQLSISTKQPVRVFRKGNNNSNSAKSRRIDSAFKPSLGIRYDGLYKVDSCRLQPRKKNGQVIGTEKLNVFRLVRVDGQLPINLSRPTRQEKADFARITDGY